MKQTTPTGVVFSIQKNKNPPVGEFFVLFTSLLPLFREVARVARNSKVNHEIS